MLSHRKPVGTSVSAAQPELPRSRNQSVMISSRYPARLQEHPRLLCNQGMINRKKLTFTLKVVWCPFNCVTTLNAFDEIRGTRLPLVTRLTRITKSRTNLEAAARWSFSQTHKWNFRAQTTDFI